MATRLSLTERGEPGVNRLNDYRSFSDGGGDPERINLEIDPDRSGRPSPSMGKARSARLVDGEPYVASGVLIHGMYLKDLLGTGESL